MTLIAAYKEYNFPVLMGDVLITGNNKEEYCKKIIKISSNFVIGWTGRKLNAIRVLKPLIETFSNHIVSMKEVEKFFLDFDTSNFLGDKNEVSLKMIGWVIDEKENCFLWNADYNEFETKELFFYEDKGIFEGSGGDFFEVLLKESQDYIFTFSNSEKILQAIGKILHELCSLTNGEYLATNRNWRNGFGFAYEALIYNGKEFNYIDNILYFTLDILSNENWEQIEYRLIPYVYRYKCYGNVSCFQISETIEGSNNIWKYYVGKGYGKDVENHFLIESAIRKNIQAISHKSSFYCITIRIINGKKVIPSTLILFGNDFIRTEHRNNATIFGFSPTFRSIVQKTIDENKY